MNFNVGSFVKFYQENEDKLIFKDGLRPAKSLTRNIFNNVDKFLKWYNNTHKTILSYNEIVNDICHLTETGYTTIEDNIRGMEELQFLIKIDDNTYKFTRNFIEYIYSEKTLENYIIEKMCKISSIEDITMFENYILATLREGVLKGYITHYPDGYPEFSSIVQDKEERARLCKEVYSLYGFKGRNNNPEDGDYTPNINYRIISTCRQLGLITVDINDQMTKHGFKKYKLTSEAIILLEQISKNIREENDDTLNSEVKTEKETFHKKIEYKNNILDDIYDELYIAESNNLRPETLLDVLDLPEPLANEYSQNSKKRDAQKAANAKAKANYLCEFNDEHHTFKSKTTQENYVEAHHLIPMQLQPKFFYSLDIEANIVALCPICHRRIHHATDEEKIEIITKLYNERIERLKKCNIYIELNDLINFYCMN